MDQSPEQQNVQREQQNVPQKQNSRMNRRAIGLTIALFLLIVAGMFAFAFLQRDTNEPQPDPAENETDERYADITRVDAKHFYIDGVHTLVGEIPMPTPCDLLESSARVAESAPEQITIEFTVVNNAEFCAQVITPQRFMVTATASEEATFGATFEGRSIDLNLIEAAPGETPEDFELYIKG